ncbi:MAG: acylphosphatase [Candidatus Korarchaeota archaeon]|nr:acylphosphatase [Candidatus Korarchaeota archaeon]NIU85410.1 acylphosphatase [Candidatus Thorarchaeota archaeon]NIW15507.1 acylphosphatase [Candidatus Thorarchaeota archaeon]NIW53452.1 acylphosphatase [Candidatus Korarchaeota archaeon]
MEKKRVHVFIDGRVQMVGFRASTRRKAHRLGINGWIKNLQDGRVEVVAEGNEKQVEELIDFLHQGPPAARVENVQITDEKYQGEFEDFRIRF